MSRSLRVAFVSPGPAPRVAQLAEGVAGRGHAVRVIAHRPGGPIAAIEGRLRRRGYLEDLTFVPFAWLALGRGDDHLAHAEGLPAATAARRWAHATGRSFVLHYRGVPDHADLMARRRKLELMQRALAAAAAVVVESEAAADALGRWLGAGGRVIPPKAGAEPWCELYDQLVP